MRGVKGVSQKLSVFKQLERMVMEEEGKKALAVPVRPTLLFALVSS